MFCQNVRPSSVTPAFYVGKAWKTLTDGFLAFLERNDLFFSADKEENDQLPIIFLLQNGTKLDWSVLEVHPRISSSKTEYSPLNTRNDDGSGKGQVRTAPLHGGIVRSQRLWCFTFLNIQRMHPGGFGERYVIFFKNRVQTKRSRNRAFFRDSGF